MQNLSEIQAAINNAADWLRSIWCSPSCGLHHAGKPSLMPTCFAVLASECCGALDQINQSIRSATADYILGCQEPQSGMFSSGSASMSKTAIHNKTYLMLQSSYFAVHALDALNMQPRYDLPLADRVRNVDYLVGWMDGGPWYSPWLHSNNIMFALCFLQAQHQRTNDDAYIDAFDRILDYLDARQDETTGVWQPERSRHDAHAVFATYHFLPFYFWRRRLPNHAERMIDTTLGIQLPDGFFISGGGACEDLDAVHILVMMSMVTDHRAADVRSSLNRFANAVLAAQNQDGGFSNYIIRRERLPRKLLRLTRTDRLLLGRRFSPPQWHYSGCTELACPFDVSDMWGTWFRSLALKLIADRYHTKSVSTLPGRYRRLPGLGWHDFERIKVAANARRTSEPSVSSNVSI